MADIFDNSEFLTRIMEGVNKGIRVVNIRSKEVYETVKIKNQIQSLKKQKKSAIDELGNSVYRVFRHKNSFDQESVRAKCVEIEKIDSKIEETEEQLRLLHENAQKELGKLKAISKPKVIATCECGAEIYEGAELCGNCLRKVESN